MEIEACARAHMHTGAHARATHETGVERTKRLRHVALEEVDARALLIPGRPLQPLSGAVLGLEERRVNVGRGGVATQRQRFTGERRDLVDSEVRVATASTCRALSEPNMVGRGSESNCESKDSHNL